MKKGILAIGVSVIIITGGVWLAKKQAGPGALDAFAKCLKEKGALFYGAFWCPHCQAQKILFGKSEKHLPYVECSTPNGKDQLAACKEKNITGYPTWFFPDGSRVEGEVSLEELSRKTSCPLPETQIN